MTHSVLAVIILLSRALAFVLVIMNGDQGPDDSQGNSKETVLARAAISGDAGAALAETAMTMPRTMAVAMSVKRELTKTMFESERQLRDQKKEVDPKRSEQRTIYTVYGVWLHLARATSDRRHTNVGKGM